MYNNIIKRREKERKGKKMKFTDGKKTVEITITDNRNDIDVTADLMEVGNMEYNEDMDAYMVEDVNYCADFAKSEFAENDVEVEIEEL